MAAGTKRKRKARRPRKGAPVPSVTVDGIPLMTALLRQIDAGGGVDGSGAYTATYAMLAMPRRPGRVGTIRYTKKPAGDGSTIAMTMEDGQCRGCVQKVSAVMHCNTGRLSTPVRWECTEEMFRGDTPVPGTKIAKSATVRDGTLTVAGAAASRTQKIGDAYTVNWALFDAVGRLPRETFEPVRFVLLDHFDQYKPNQAVHYRNSLKVALKTGPVMLHLYDHFGCGNLPWTYFVNDGGIMVLAVAGLEAYGLAGITGGSA